jgi:hypothetical protein
VVAETMVVNAASRRVMEKAGLKYVRTFHQPWPYAIEGSEHGDVEYALRKADWERQQRTRRDPSPEVAGRVGRDDPEVSGQETSLDQPV